MRQLYKLMFTLEGRISRRSFWVYYLCGASLLAPLVTIQVWAATSEKWSSPVLVLITSTLALAWIYGAIAIGIKRLHDIGKSGAMYLIAFIPYIGQAWVIFYLGFAPGSPNRNRYGNPTK